MDEYDIDTFELKKALDYIDSLWPELQRSVPEDDDTLIGLPNPYIAPSIDSGTGFMFDEQYYWDSYFISKGLLLSGHQNLASGMLENLLHLFKRFGLIPNANRYYFTSRSQAPLLTSYINDIFATNQDSSWLKHAMELAEKEYFNVWCSVEHPSWRNVFEGLSRYYDINLIDGLAEAESGWDTTTRFGDRCLSFIPVDLNSLLYKYEVDLAEFYRKIDQEKVSKLWQQRAEKRRTNVNQYLWDDGRGFYFDFDFSKQKQGEVWSLAGFYPMWAGLVSRRQAEKLVAQLKLFKYDGGLSATTQSDSVLLDNKNRQWAYPNGWAQLHWVVVNALEKYGFAEEAREIALNWLKTNLDYFNIHGMFREAYNVVDPAKPPNPGLYPPQTGYASTNGVFIDFAHKYVLPHRPD